MSAVAGLLAAGLAVTAGFGGIGSTAGLLDGHTSCVAFPRSCQMIGSPLSNRPWQAVHVPGKREIRIRGVVWVAGIYCASF